LEPKILALRVNDKDNVATLFSNGAEQGLQAEVRDQRGDSTAIELRDNIPYGHKIALTAIAAGVPIVKYGEEIGVAVKDIKVGEHVHVHNMDSQRARGDLAPAKEE
jgi:altronate dehydratase small subunit